MVYAVTYTTRSGACRVFGGKRHTSRRDADKTAATARSFCARFSQDHTVAVQQFKNMEEAFQWAHNKQAA